MSKTKDFLQQLMSSDSVSAVDSIKESLSEQARKALLESQTLVAEKYGMKKVKESEDEDSDDTEYDSEDGDGDDKEDDEDKE